MTHENQDWLPKKHVLNQTVPLENVFYRVRPPRQDGPSRGNVERGKDETSYMSLNDGSSSTLRVQRSSHSSRVHRVNSHEYRIPVREQVWKEKQQPLRTVKPAKKRMDMDTVRTYSSPKKNFGNRGKSVVALLDRSQNYKRDDMNVTYRDGTGSGKSTVEGGTADDLIPPYDALKIDALSEQEQDEEEQLVDADMKDAPVGNELMVLEEDDLLEEDLNQIENQELIELDRSQPLLASEHDNSILMIEAKEKTVDDDTGEDYAKALTRSSTRSLFSTSQAVSRRASPRINDKPKTAQGSGARGQRGHQQATALRRSKTVQKKGMVDAKHPPQPH
ncbi:hypothetical protein YC2023_060507 [Brassica napus]